MDFRTLFRNVSLVHGRRATPTTAKFSPSLPCRYSRYIEGKSLRRAKSPVAPKITITAFGCLCLLIIEVPRFSCCDLSHYVYYFTSIYDGNHTGTSVIGLAF